MNNYLFYSGFLKAKNGLTVLNIVCYTVSGVCYIEI